MSRQFNGKFEIEADLYRNYIQRENVKKTIRTKRFIQNEIFFLVKTGIISDYLIFCFKKKNTVSQHPSGAILTKLPATAGDQVVIKCSSKYRCHDFPSV